MNGVGTPSLDQLRIFLTVASEGSFNRAAKKLGRAISAISYGVAQLEAQLGVSLFEREGSRRPVLTEAGTALLGQARAVSDDVDNLVATARSLHQGVEPELSLAVDVMVPGQALAQLLRDFQLTYPLVPLRLHVEALGAVAALVVDRKATFAIAGPDIVDHPELARQHVGSVEMVPVAAAAHPLAHKPAPGPGDAARHLQLVLTDRSPLTEGRDFSVLGNNTWRLADLGAKHALLREGIGWGYMPRHAVTTDLESGVLVELHVPESASIDFGLVALWRKDDPPGPAACWIRDECIRRFGNMRVAIDAGVPISRS